jgi:hypothetical protein
MEELPRALVTEEGPFSSAFRPMNRSWLCLILPQAGKSPSCLEVGMTGPVILIASRACGPHAPYQLSGFPLPPGWDASAHAFPSAPRLRGMHLFLVILVLLGLLEFK